MASSEYRGDMGDDSRFRYRRDDSAGQDGRRAPAAPRGGPSGAPQQRPAAGAPPSRRDMVEPATQDRVTRPPRPATIQPAPSQAAGGDAGDPLAELARLIDEQDPFANTSAQRQPPEGARPAQPAAQPHAGMSLREEAQARLEAARARQTAAQASPSGAATARQQVATREDDARRQLARQELARYELARREQARQELARQERARHELAQREQERQNFIRQELERQKQARQSGVRATESPASSSARTRMSAQSGEAPARQDASRQDSAGQAPSREVPTREISSPQASAQRGARPPASASSSERHVDSSVDAVRQAQLARIAAAREAQARQHAGQTSPEAGRERAESRPSHSNEPDAARRAPPSFLTAGSAAGQRERRVSPQAGALDERLATDPNLRASAEQAARATQARREAAARTAAMQGAAPSRPASSPDGRRAPGLHNPPPRAATPATSTAERAADAASSVRLGYGSLANERAAQAQQAEVSRHAERPRVAPSAETSVSAPRHHAEEPQAHPDAASYAYSAERRSAGGHGYDDYDEAYDPQYADEGYMPPHGEEIYDGDAQRQKGRRALMAAAAALAIVVVSAAGYFAFRMGGDDAGGTSGNGTPVIKADTTPSKIMTPPSQQDAQQKLIYDRVGTGARGDEQMLPREEQPVDVSSAAAIRTAPPEGITPESTEPKRVRTLTVRADGTVVPEGTVVAASPNTSGLTAYSADQDPVPGGLPEPTGVTTVTTENEPETTPEVAVDGQYVVQVSSQRSSSDAQGSWRALQTRYPNLLSSYAATIKRVDLGERGIFYRAQVGPFATRDDANSLCQALRAQGGDCVVNRE
ncbi:SPOR domain-containing protein [Xanthobacter sp. TB0139]|uniref:SPOR domain-containing protein n=1 Tax=Xanthobacter sp. TB0139 TaxID=3459178 RepID=UPI00403A2E88